MREAGFTIRSFRYRAPNRYMPLPVFGAGIDMLATSASRNG